MIIHSAALASSGISSLGMAIADTARSDLQSKYMKYTVENMKYAKHRSEIF